MERKVRRRRRRSEEVEGETEVTPFVLSAMRVCTHATSQLRSSKYPLVRMLDSISYL